MQRRDIDNIENKLNAILRLEVACEFKHLYGKSNWVQFPADLSAETLEQYSTILKQLGLQVQCHANEDELDGPTRSIEFDDSMDVIITKLNLHVRPGTELVVRHSFAVIPAPTQGVNERKPTTNLKFLSEPAWT